MESYDVHSEFDTVYMGRRKGRKLMAEKRRRARINQCLNQIKDIVCGAEMRNDPTFDKMEKAEILESTVDYLKNVRKINTTDHQVKETVQARFRQGYSRCAEEFLTYIQSLPGVSDNVQHQLRKQFSGRMSHFQQVSVTSSTHPVTSYQPFHDERLRASHSSCHQGTLPSANVQTSTCSSPENSFTDSGIECSPETRKCSKSKVQHRSDCHSDSELYNVESRISTDRFHEARVSAWVESTLSYSQQIKMEQQAPWRPW